MHCYFRVVCVAVVLPAFSQCGMYVMVCMYACMHACMVCMFGMYGMHGMYVCMYVCMYGCMYV